MDVKDIIKLAMESLPMSDLNEENYHNFLHEIKNMVLDVDKIKMKELSLDERMNLLLLEHENLKNMLEDICDLQHNKIKIPHRCPVCNGSTFDEEGALCHPCDGKGIVWG
jgi:hypothetical protein